MASCITAQWDTHKATMTSPQMKLTVTEESSTGAQSTLAWTLQYIASSAANTTGNIAYKVVIAGTTQKSSSYDIDGKTGTYTVASGTVTVSKGTSAKSVAFSVSVDWEITWSGVYCASKTASGSISVPAKTSYKVTYSANGGSGAPSAQTKWYGTALTLSSTKPTRTGYTFKGWATSSTGSVAYAAGASYTSNASATLYAIWQANTYTVSYNANGGSGAPAAQTKTHGTALTLSTTKPTRTNYTFLGWATSASATTISYSPGGSYTANAGITLYAVWQLAYKKPRINGLSITRCDSSGTASEDGAYANVQFTWATDKEVSSITVTWVSIGGSSGSETVPASGTSGNVRQIIGSGELSSDLTYTLAVTAADAGGNTSISSTLSGKSYTLDFLAGGKGVAIFKPAEKEGLEIGGNVYDKYSTKIGNGLAEYTGGGEAAIDPDTTLDFCILTNTNTPTVYFHFILTFFYNGKNVSSNRAQLALPYQSGGKSAWRYYNGGSWSEWAALTKETHNHLYAAIIGGMYCRENRIDFYNSSDDAKNQTNKKGMVGHDGSTTLYVKNEAGGSVYLCSNSNGTGAALLTDRFRSTYNDAYYLGDSNYKWKAVYAVNGTIQTSDRNQKTDIAPIDEKYIALFDKLQPVTFKLAGSEHDRTHIGMIAQDVKAAMDEVGLTPEDFAAYCRDKKIETIQVEDPETGEKSEEDIEVLDKDGNPVYLYSLRYTEIISLNTRMIQENRKEIAALKEENAELKKRLKKIEAMLGIEESEETT